MLHLTIYMILEAIFIEMGQVRAVRRESHHGCQMATGRGEGILSVRPLWSRELGLAL